MLGQAIIEEKYKENMKDIIHSVQCNENLGLENQLLLSGLGGAKKFRTL